MKSLILATVIAFTGVFSSLAQPSGKYGSNEDLCLRNYSLYKGYLKNGDIEDAKRFWQKMIGICPEYSSGIWADGEKIYKARISESKDPLQRGELVDSLIWIYDERIRLFGDNPRIPEGYILGKKGIAILKYGIHPVMEGYNALKRSVELQKTNSNAAVILTLMKAAKELYSTGQLDAEDVIDNYSVCMKIADLNLQKKPGDEKFTKAKNGIEQYLISSKAADCPVLVEIFSSQFQENKDNSEWLNKTVNLLKSTGCSDTELYAASSEALYALHPSAASAHKLANIYFTKGSFDKTVEYLTKGVELGEETEENASMYYELAYIHYIHMEDYQAARSYARKAIELRPNWGDPYILIGRIYVDDRKSVSEKEFEQNAVFWAAVDKFIQAKNVDPEQTKRANDLINQYSQYFPVQDDVFMWTFQDGMKYNVGGWINEQTTVRSRK